jgi:beta-lactamase superfamily II metal-dependent hydrolase
MSTLEIFDVQHGQCSLVTSTTGERMLIDCGHNSETGWRPSTHLKRLGIGWLDQLTITNYDEDHASDLPGLRDAVGIGILARNPSVSGADIRQLKTHGGIGNGIAMLADMTSGYDVPVSNSPVFDGMTEQHFWNVYPSDFTDENNLSLVTILRWPRMSICFGGDMETAGWKRLLDRSDFRAAMQNVTIFVASHHGRENGYCRELFEWTGLNPELIVISDSGIQHATQQTVAAYRQHARGVHFDEGERRVLTTRRDGKIRFNMLTCEVWKAE